MITESIDFLKGLKIAFDSRNTGAGKYYISNIINGEFLIIGSRCGGIKKYGGHDLYVYNTYINRHVDYSRLKDIGTEISNHDFTKGTSKEDLDNFWDIIIRDLVINGARHLIEPASNQNPIEIPKSLLEEAATYVEAEAISERQGSRAPMPVMYRNPNDKTQTWSGRGASPKWVSEMKKLGYKLKDLKID